MIFQGVGRVFSTENDGQYETIGAFWDEMAARYGVRNLRGLGFHWTDRSIEYVIGLREGAVEGSDRRVELPDAGWVSVRGRTEDLAKIYDAVYRDGPLLYEIEMFTEDGGCEILYRR